MIAQIGLTVLLIWATAYAWAEYRRAPLIGTVAVLVATAGLYFVWLPAHASWLAAFVGIGRGVDLILYVWLVISLTMFLDLHLKLRSQTEVITALAKANAGPFQAERRRRHARESRSGGGSVPPGSGYEAS